MHADADPTTNITTAVSGPAVSATAITTLALELIDQATRQRQRRLLLLAGEQRWGQQMASTLLQAWHPPTLLWIGSRLPAEAPATGRCVAAANCHQLLGQEVQALVFDAWDGFDPDAFGAVSGTLRAGGLLVLLTPPLEQWQHFNDPQHARIVSAPTPAEQIRGRYLRRLARIFADAREATVVHQDRPLQADIASATPTDTNTNTNTNTNFDFDPGDQQRAVAAVIKVANGHRRRPVVLTADRGRGKSAALGIAAAELMRAGPCHIAVSGPRLDAVLPVFKHCAQRLSDATVSDGRVQTATSLLHFVAPDVLLESPLDLDLLLIDEAAALPTDLLQRLLRHYNRIAFATTVHGYEGSGRGFALRFNRLLDQATRGWRALLLETPIRWTADDPLEALTFRALLLDAEAAPDAIASAARPENCSAELLNRDQLVDDPASLNELFGLLVLSHYRTRPYDLRQLLDGSNVSIWVLRHQHQQGHHRHIIGTALLATEGGFDADTSAAIWAGQRRPHGHLLPEALAAHLGLQQAAALRCQRIMRIAIHPQAQRRGLGGMLLSAIAQDAQAAGHAGQPPIDYLGSSFAADPELLSFWQRNGYQPARISARPGARSGGHSAIVMRGLNAAGSTLTALASERFHAQLAVQLKHHLSMLDSTLALRLMMAGTDTGTNIATYSAPGKNSAATPPLDRQDWQDLLAFGCAKRGYEDCLSPIDQLCRHALRDPDNPLTAPQRLLLMATVLQRRSWRDLASQAGQAGGRAGIITELRNCIRALLLRYAPAPIRERVELRLQAPPAARDQRRSLHPNPARR